MQCMHVSGSAIKAYEGLRKVNMTKICKNGLIRLKPTAVISRALSFSPSRLDPCQSAIGFGC